MCMRVIKFMCNVLTSEKACIQSVGKLTINGSQSTDCDCATKVL